MTREDRIEAHSCWDNSWARTHGTNYQLEERMKRLQKILHLINQHVDKHGEVTLLDAGCGTGLVIEGFVRSFQDLKRLSIIGIDFSSRAITVSKRRVNGATFVVGDIEHLPFRYESFHIVYYGSSLRYTLNRDAALKDAHRVLKKRGTICALEANIMNPLLRSHGALYEVLGHRRIRRLSGLEWMQILKLAGFSMVQLKYLNFLPPIVLKKKTRLLKLFLILERLLENTPWIKEYSGSIFLIARK